MKKTINITIGGLLFAVEEDAYEKLNAYLNGIKAHFAHSADREEIINDIEARISERFSGKPKMAGTTVITINDIDELIAAMGRVEDFEGGEKTAPSQEPSPAKRLYRNPDDMIIAGVCSGIAAYFGIDPVVVRLIFGLSLFFGGFGLLLYIILWVIMPEAKTPAQKAAMRGAPTTLAGIEQTIKERVQEFKEGHKGQGAEFKQGARGAAGKVASGLGTLIRGAAKVLVKILGLVIIIGSAIALFALTFGLTTLLFNGNSPAVQFPLRDVVSGVPYILLLLSAFFVLFVPVLFLLTLGGNILRGSSGISKTVAFSLLGLWIVALLTGGVAFGKYGPEIKTRMQEHPNFKYTEKSFSQNGFTGISVGNATRVTLQPGEAFGITAKGRQADLDMLELTVNNGVLNINQKTTTAWCVFCMREPVQVTITMPELRSVKANGTSRVSINRFAGQTMDMELSGASKITGVASPIGLNVKASGASSIELSALPELSRTSGNLNLKLSGASKANLAGLMFETAVVDFSGASKATIHAFTSISGKMSGASKLEYYSEPKISIQTSGSSKYTPIGSTAPLPDPESEMQFESF